MSGQREPPGPLERLWPQVLDEPSSDVDAEGAEGFAAYLDDLHQHGHDPLGIADLDCWPHPDRHPLPDPTLVDAVPAAGEVRPSDRADLTRTDFQTTTSHPSGAVTARPSGDGRSGAGSGKIGQGAGKLVRRWLPDGPGDRRFEVGRRQAVALAAVVLLAALVAGALVWRSRPVPEAVPALTAATQDGPMGESVDLVVSIAGLVAAPGLVRLEPGARVADAIQAAGGPAPGTDLTGVNLARRLTDGEHVVVGPAASSVGVGSVGTGGAAAPAARQPAGAPPAAAGAPAGSGARLDLNTATLGDLDALPGVGPVTAQRILDWRAQHGRFSSVEQLREIDGIGETRFSKLKNLVLA